MDRKKSIVNVSVSIIFRLLLLIASLFVRRYLIRYIGNEANGLDSLYTSIVGFLSIAELGVGTAITFCMYKPILEGNHDKVSALFWLFRKLYVIIGAVILVCGCIVMPFLPYLARDYSADNMQLYLTFALMLISIILTYAFSAEISLINAYKNNYIATSIQSGGQLLQYGLQIVVLIYTHSFIWYFVCRIIAVAVQWAITEIVSHKKYNYIIKNKQQVDKETKGEVSKNVKALFMHRIGGVMVNTADSIIISTFIGVAILGKYSNYTVIMTAMMGTISLFFTPLTSIIGHLYLKENTESIKKYYNFFYNLNFILGLIFFLGYYATIDNLVTICFGSGLEMPKSTSFVITANYFIQFMRQSTTLFRDATGTFYNDRWKPVLEGVVNVILSISFVYLFQFIWGDNFAVVGVIVATIITNLFICHIIEPFVLYKHAFRSTPKYHYIRNYLSIIVFTGMLFVMNYFMIDDSNQVIELFANGGISLAFSFIMSLLTILLNKDFRNYIKHTFKLLIKRENASEDSSNNESEHLESTSEEEK